MFELGRLIPGGVAFFSKNIRSKATFLVGDTRFLLIIVVFSVFYTSLITVILSIKKHRLATFWIGTLLITDGFAISFGLTSVLWQTGRIIINTRISNRIIATELGVHFGLEKLNITLQGIKQEQDKGSAIQEIYFNEKIFYDQCITSSCSQHFLIQGLPDAIITVASYLDGKISWRNITPGSIGTQWIFSYNRAGYISKSLLFFALASWLFTTISFSATPGYAHHFLGFSSIFILASPLAYHISLSDFPFVVYVDGKFLTVSYGIVFWILIGCGIASLLTNFCLFVYQDILGERLFTAFEMDHDNYYFSNCNEYLWEHRVLDTETRKKLNRRYDPRCINFSMQKTRNEDEVTTL